MHKFLLTFSSSSNIYSIYFLLLSNYLSIRVLMKSQFGKNKKQVQNLLRNPGVESKKNKKKIISFSLPFLCNIRRLKTGVGPTSNSLL